MSGFDYNSTTPLAPAARDAWLQACAEAWANPASAHRAGARVRVRLEQARARLAGLLGGDPDALVFTSGATEGANAVFAHAAAHAPADACALVGATEHACVQAAAARWFPGRVAPLPLDADGIVILDTLRDWLAAGRVSLVAALAANNETGVLHPWREIAALCRTAGVPYLCDATQWLGKLPADGLGAAGFVLGSAHKFGGPKGVGLLVLPAGGPACDFNFIAGGAQQAGRRAGTEDYPGVAALVAALAATTPPPGPPVAVRQGWRAAFERDLVAALPGTRIVGAGADRLWNTVMVVLPTGENHRWLTKLDKRGFEVGTSAACTSGPHSTSHVLAALGFPATEARRALRFSSGWETTEADWRALLAALVEVRDELAAGP